MNNPKFIVPAFVGSVLAFGLMACGDESTTNETIVNNTGMESVATVDDMMKCDSTIAGQTIFVKGEGIFYGCDGKEWKEFGGNSMSVGENFCSSKELSDGSGFDIYCNDKLIGTVKNGAKGETGATGEKGDKGDTGAQGDKGDKGDTGAQGDKGDKGDTGSNGSNGVTTTVVVYSSPAAESSSSAEEDNNECSIVSSTESSVTIGCGSETFEMQLYKPVVVTEPKVCEDNDIEYGDLECANAQELVGISGQSQKGPFTKGASVDAYELANATLKQTGNSFKGTIEEDNGLFNISTVKLASQYVYLVADGFYRNEVTGLESNSTIRLRALADMGRATMANINLVTHLEYDRVFYLVNNVKNANGRNMRPLLAKKQAESEIFKNFFIDDSKFKERANDDYLYAEDMDVLTEGDGNAALLAISVLLQGDRTEAQLTSMLASFSVDIARDGSWDRVKDRAEIADWAMEADFSGKLDGIRAKIDAWKLGGASKAPAFEHHVRNFWYQELGLGDCSGAKDGMLNFVSNPYSKYYAQKNFSYTEGDSSRTRFICVVPGGDDEPYWRKATDLEADTYGWPTALSGVAQGDAEYGKINTDFVYVYEDAWRLGTELDKELSTGCIEDLKSQTESLTKDGKTTWYICDGSWREANEAEADTAGWQSLYSATDSVGQVRAGNVNASNAYVYENGGYRPGTSEDLLLKSGCNYLIRNDIRKIGETFYTCANEPVVLRNGEKVNYSWRKSTAAEADTYGWETSTSGDLRNGQVDPSNVYVFDFLWRRGTDLDLLIGTGCSTANLNKIMTDGEKYYKCASEAVVERGVTVPRAWRLLTLDEEVARLGTSCTDGSIMKTVNSQSPYVCDTSLSAKWRSASALELELNSGCTIGKQTYAKAGSFPKGEVVYGSNKGKYYWCGSNGWEVASRSRSDTYGLACDNSSRDAVYKTRYYVCDADTFRTITYSERWAYVVTGYSTKNIRCGASDHKKTVAPNAVKGYWACEDGYYVWNKYPYKDESNNKVLDKSSNAYSIAHLGSQVWTLSNSLDGKMTEQYGYKMYTYANAPTACSGLGEPVLMVSTGIQWPSKYKVPSLSDWVTLFKNAGLVKVNDTTWAGASVLESMMNFKYWAPGLMFSYDVSGGYATVEDHPTGSWMWTSDGRIIEFDNNQTVHIGRRRTSQSSLDLAAVRCIASDITMSTPVDYGANNAYYSAD